ncbi:uncharacterized protein LOC130196785 isoform X1 [Pseudoliparis swirei]|uniref:uncharacterized protein LOC130196785 isoform X1 n=1 Tax=Pseudoliparis swirei TaxID=2059687 RepID=UPI0024BE6F68|nr:uncharacterized protein LOC130196785 isoform X1 [Pseudoliparis swirei]XP_056275126.1 uncharacterized protein LOC130196785 isoform X1 [Pseudoliparis swirei]XP_056275127.1 uncharacterized protein LOC130196785 isoform X1 [Pseudoliparis swirei]
MCRALFLHLRHPPHLPDDEKEVFNPEHRAADRHNWDHEFLSHMQQDSSGVGRVLVLFVVWCSACCPRDDEWTPVLMRQPGVHLPAVFDPALVAQLNAASERVLGQMKYPAFHLSSTDTGEKFGLQYVEPGCRPVPVDWDKHRTKSDSAPPALNPPPQSSVPTAQSSSLFMAPQKLFQFPPRPPVDSAAVKPDVTPGPPTDPETCRPSLPLLSSPTAARTGPVKTGGRVFVLDHKRWPAPMKATIDNLLNKHRGMKDMLKLVDQDYAALVHNSCTDPNNMLHPTTKHHILLYVKHLCKLLNTSSSLNTSPKNCKSGRNSGTL